MVKKIILLLLVALPAFGQNYFTNSSFELPDLGGIVGGNIFTGFISTNNDGQPNGWVWSTGTGGGTTASGGGLTTAGNFLSPEAAPDGSQLGFILGSGTMTQIIQIPSNGVYTLSFWVGMPSTYFAPENFTLQVNGVNLNRWLFSSLGNTKLQFISTNITLNAGANSIWFIGDTNGCAPGSLGGYGLNFDLVQTGPFTPGFTFNNSIKQAFSDGSYNGTANAVGYIQSQAANGWTLFIGTNGGVYTWSNQLSCIIPYNLTIAGASPTNPPTIIFNESSGYGIYLDDQFTTLKDLIFNTGAKIPGAAIVGIDGSNVCFRLSNLEFFGPSQVPTAAAIRMPVAGVTFTHTLGPWGLVDHCNFYFSGGEVYNYLNCRANGSADRWCWSNNMTWGTTNTVMIENCNFGQPYVLPISGLCEGDGGERICIRYCNITNIPQSTHGAQSGSQCGMLQEEFYENHCVFSGTNDEDTANYCFLLRGGSAVVWSNTVLNQMAAGIFGIGIWGKFWDECAGTNSAYQNFLPSGAAYNSSGYYIYTITNDTPYLFWGGPNDVGFAFSTNNTGTTTATYTTIENNEGFVSLPTNFPTLYLYLKGTPSQPVTCGIRNISGDLWYQEGCNPRLFYPTNYPSLNQIGQGVVNLQQGYQPVYIWSNSLPVAQFGNFALGDDSGDAAFIQQGRDIFTNSVMPGYVPLVFPSPMDTTNQPAPPPPLPPSKIIPLGNLGNSVNLH